jgi:hypothetical protein
MTKDEPVAYFNPQEGGFYWAKPTKIEAPITVDVEPLPLYTAPPNLKERAEGLQRDYDLLFNEYKVLKQEQSEPKEWVGLSEEEIKEVMSKYYSYNPRLLSFALEIKAKLKEKNGYD